MATAAAYDVFLCYKSSDKSVVEELGRKLQERGLSVWLDVWESRPGRSWQEEVESIIKTVRSAAVFVGRDGLGPWEKVQMQACLGELQNRQRPVIPVLLPETPKEPELPLFLKQRTWVDLRGGLKPKGLDGLHWGITGERPDEKLHLRIADNKLKPSAFEPPDLEQSAPKLAEALEHWNRADEIAAEGGQQGATRDKIKKMAEHYEERWCKIGRARAAKIAVRILDHACGLGIEWDQLRVRRVHALVLEAVLRIKEGLLRGRPPAHLLGLAADHVRSLVDPLKTRDCRSGVKCVIRIIKYIEAAERLDEQELDRIAALEVRILDQMRVLSGLEFFDHRNVIYRILLLLCYIAGRPLDRAEAMQRSLFEDSEDSHTAFYKELESTVELGSIMALDSVVQLPDYAFPREHGGRSQHAPSLLQLIPQDILCPEEAPQVVDFELGIVNKGEDLVVHAGRHIIPRHILSGLRKLDSAAREFGFLHGARTADQRQSSEQMSDIYETLLFPTPIRSLIHKKHSEAREAGVPVRIRLTISASLEHLPFEAINAEGMGGEDNGAMSGSVLLSRTLARCSQEAPPVVFQGPIKICLAGACAIVRQRKSFERQFKEHRNELSALEGIQLEPVLGSGTRASLAAAGEHGIEILFFAGWHSFDAHRGEYRLLFEDEDGAPEAVYPGELRTLLKSWRHLRLVCLWTSKRERPRTPPPRVGLIEALFDAGASGVILAPRHSGDALLREFWLRLALELRHGAILEEAVAAARRAIRRRAPASGSWAAPVLYSNTEPGKSFRLRHPVKRVLPPRT